MIPIVYGIERDPLFVLREDFDAELIAQWHLVLPMLSDKLLVTNRGAQGRISSIHLFRVGKTQAESRPTIIINTSQSLSSVEERQLRSDISSRYLCPGGPRGGICLADFVKPSDSLQVMFKQSKVRRSVGSSSSPFPPICQPRNRQFSRIPGTGASIGIAGSFEDTATLGCYILVNSVLMILTVDHLIPETNIDPHLTHISQQDRFEMMLPSLVARFRDLTASSQHLCGFCATFQDPERQSEEEICAALIHILKASPYVECSMRSALKSAYQINSSFQEHTIAKQFRKSNTGCRGIGPDAREMDWAVFRVGNDFSLEERQYLLNRHDKFITLDDLYVHDSVKPGALVRSFGRTSAHQLGKISTSISAIFHEHYATQEWCVIKRPEDSLDEWIRGGIGVEGDSGALIVDEEDDGIYGMLWGRVGDGPATMTIFTPLREIFFDIRERTGQNVEFLRGQQMPRPESVEVAEASHHEQTVPITISLEENGLETLLEEAAYSLEISRQPSADTRHPHCFERYRGRDRPNPAVPRSATQIQVQATDGSVESRQWPGVHTYLRYAMAPEQE